MKMKKYPKIKEIGDVDNRDINKDGKIHITEKMDGTNIRFIFERLMGITHEMKYRCTKEKLQKYADSLNKQDTLKEEVNEEMK